MYSTYLPFVRLGGGVEAELFFFDLSSSSTKVRVILFEMINTVTDALVVCALICLRAVLSPRYKIHRLYVIWGHRFSIVAFPLLLLVALVGESRLRIN